MKVCESAICALGLINDKDSVSHLLKMLDKKYTKEVRESAVWALGKICDTIAVDELIKTLLYDDNENVQSTAAWALGQMGLSSKRIILALSNALSKFSGIVFQSAVSSLGSIGDPSCVIPLIDALNGRKDEPDNGSIIGA